MFLTDTKEGDLSIESFRSGRKINERVNYIRFVNLLWISLGLFLILMFMPWTQNIRAKGYVTALKPDQRPQEIHSIIAGRIEKWYITEGKDVKKGDTIAFISETKDAYFDPKLLGRTESQVQNKELSVKSYQEKIQALENQVTALRSMQGLKVKQAQNKLLQAGLKVTSDSMDYLAFKQAYEIAQEQLIRMEKLYKDGIKSLTDLETRRMKGQESLSKMIAQENKWIAAKNEQLNAQMEIVNVQNEYRDKLSKAESDMYTAMTQSFEAQNDVAKLQNQMSNYTTRFGMHYILAPQDGFISKIKIPGIGETLKEGDVIATIVPSKIQKAVEMFIDPIDLPLVNPGQQVNLFFDGWPSIVFSGWPNLSYGTFSSAVFSVDRNISENGQYRVLLIPNNSKVPWPEAVQMGSGAVGMALLKNVPVWYELWRQFSGFPPDYYIAKDTKKNQKDKPAK